MKIKALKILRFIPYIGTLATMLTILTMRPNAIEAMKMSAVMLLLVPIFFAVLALSLVFPNEIVEAIAMPISMWALGIIWGTYIVKKLEKEGEK